MDEANNQKGNGEDLTEKQDGMVKIENGQLEVVDQRGAGNPAKLIHQEGIKLWVNGKEVSDVAVVSSKDEIKVEEKTFTDPPKAEVEISPDQMSATLTVIPEKKTYYRLLDQPWANTVYLKTEKEEIFTEKRPSKEELLKKLKEQGIVFGLDAQKLEKIISGETDQGVVAEGKPPEEGSDGYVEYYFEREVQAIQYESENEKVDFRERYRIPQVAKGDLLAVLHPPVEGVPGKRVTGEEISPQPVKEAVIKCGDGAVLNDHQVFSTIDGRPLLKKGKEAFISVEPLYVHQGNVDMNSGNVRFKGHLKVRGEVSEGMTVQADGDLEVENNAAGAHVLAGGNITFSRNCINCQVQAGGYYLFCQELSLKLDHLQEMVDSSMHAVEQLIEALKARGFKAEEKFPAYIQTLLQTKFPEIPENMQAIEDMIKKSEYDLSSSVQENLKALRDFFLGEGWKQAKDATTFRKMVDAINEANDTLKSLSVKRSHIESYYVQNSFLKCTGDIYVSGPGSYNSQFECGGKIYIQKLFRGGSIDAGDNVVIGEAGTPGSALSQGIIQVPKEKTITINKVHEGTRIKIGSYTFRFQDMEHNIRARLDKEEDRIKVSYQ